MGWFVAVLLFIIYSITAPQNHSEAEDVYDFALQVEQGSLYPALQRIEERGWIASYWGTSESNRRARFYKLTAKGKRQLAAETSRWESLAQAVSQVMRPV